MRAFLNRFLPYASLICLFVLLTFASPYFLTAGNLSSVIRQTTVITIMAIGMTAIMASGGIDLSVGSVLGFAGAVLGLAIVGWGWPFWAAAGLAISAAEAIDRELELKVPLAAQGGYIPTLDHSIPPDVSYENFMYYFKRKK